MAPETSSPTNRRYLISLEAPASLTVLLKSDAVRWMSHGLLESPLTGILPVLELSLPPGPPVSGLLPPCTRALKIGVVPLCDEASRWWMLPVDSGGWFELLAETLKESGRRVASAIEPSETLFPMGRGVPLAAPIPGREESTGGAAEIIYRDLPGWRALKLICREIEYPADRCWYLSASWRTLWERRLRRAPAMTNNSKSTKLA